jgi:transcriptional regulator with XRE-family HTH domain
MNVPTPGDSLQNPATILSRKIQDAMNTQNISIRDIAEKTEGSYENIRRVVKGVSVPSIPLLRSICEILGLDRAAISDIAKGDRIRQKYGSVPIELTGKKPSLEPVDRLWDELKPDQQEMVISMVESWAQLNRKNKTV